MSRMREKKQAIVCTTATGCVEGDMLGQILIWVERQNRPYSHKLHRKELKKYSFLSRSEVASMIAYGGGSRSPSVLKRGLRRFCALPGKGYRMVRGYISSMRKNKRNGN